MGTWDKSDIKVNKGRKREIKSGMHERMGIRGHSSQHVTSDVITPRITDHITSDMTHAPDVACHASLATSHNLHITFQAAMLGV